MHHRIDPTIRHIRTHERLQHTAHILEINLHQPVSSAEPALAIFADTGGTTGVDGDDFPALVGEVTDGGATEFARAAGDDDAGFAVAARGFAEGKGAGEGGRFGGWHVGYVVFEEVLNSRFVVF